MNKRFISIIAAAAVITTGSPLCANALYTEMLSPDRTGYTKVDFLCTETNDYYIISNKPYSDDEQYLYYREARHEYKYYDRIYFNVTDDDTETRVDSVAYTTNKVTEAINTMFEDFVTDNGDGIRVCINFFKYNNSFENGLGYYVEPVNSEKEGKRLKITPNDARRIKEILTKDNFAADLIYSDDVCCSNRGRINFSRFYFNVRNKSIAEQMEEGTLLQDQIIELAEEKGYDINVSSGYGSIDISPKNDMTFEKMYGIAEQIVTNFDNLVPECMFELSASGENFGGIDLMNAVDGDSNCDEQMDMADVVFIMQSLANPDKYQLSAQGSFNADMDGNGITVGDAQNIQEILLGLK